MPKPLKDIVQAMVDAGETEEAIASVIKRHGELNPAQPAPQEVPSSQADTFAGGVMDSLMNGEALKAGAKGALGFLKGSTLDIPRNIIGGLGMVANAAMHPVDTLMNAPTDLSNMASSIGDTFSKAGSDPEAFGRLMGNVTGQPLVTAGLTKGIPRGTFGSTSAIPSGLEMASEAASSAKPYAGAALENVGRVMRNKQPITRTIPGVKMISPFLSDIEKATGGGMENLGKRMQVPEPTKIQINPELLKRSEAPIRKYPKVPVKQGVVDAEPEVVAGERVPSNRLNPASSTQAGPETGPRKLLNRATETDKSTPTGTKPKPKTGSGPFTGEGDVDLKALPKVVTDKLHQMIDETFGNTDIGDEQNVRTNPQTGQEFTGDSPAKPDFASQVDSRISGLLPEESRVSNIANRMVNPQQLDSRISGLPPEARLPERRAIPRDPTAVSSGGFLDTLSKEAARFGMSLPEYLKSLDDMGNGGQGFTMPSSAMPRVR